MFLRVTSAAVFTTCFVLLTVANKAAFVSPCGSTVVLTVTALQQLFVVLLVVVQDMLSGTMGHIEYSRAQALRVLPVGVLSALDVTLSNLALRLLPLSIFQIVKCLTPAFVLVLGFIFGTSKPSWVLGLSILLIVGGSVQSVYSSMDSGPQDAIAGSNVTAGHSHRLSSSPVPTPLGLLVLLVAIAASSLRTVVSQLLVRRSSESQMPPVSTASATFHSALQMLVIMSFAAGAAETEAVRNFRSCEPVPMELCWIVVTIMLAYVVSVMTFWLTLVTSALTTALCALLQRLATVLLAIVLLGEAVQPNTWIGFFISLAGILLYNFDRKIEAKLFGREEKQLSEGAEEGKCCDELRPIVGSPGIDVDADTSLRRPAYGATDVRRFR